MRQFAEIPQPIRVNEGTPGRDCSYPDVVLVHRERWAEIRETVLEAVHDMILKVAHAKGYLLSRAGILADHVHLVLGCPIEVAPADVALGFLNNLAFAHEMRPVYQFGAFLGTVGEYDWGAVVTKTAAEHRTSLDAGKPRRGEEGE